MSTIDFFKESLKNIKTVGTLTPSSKFLCKGMIKHVDFKTAKVIVELGAGDGVITKHILQNMRKDTKLLVFEVNENFCELLREIDDDRLIIAEDSAERLSHYLDQIGEKEIDFIVSAIPFVTLPDDLSYRIVRECKKYLRKGGLYIQVHYSLLIKKMYEKIFGNVDVSIVPINFPPAFVLVSENR